MRGVQASDRAGFGIGDARVSVANLATHQMTVTLNGRTIATYPISGGKPTDPTMGGVHIVLDRQSVVRMNSATNGVPVNSPDGYDELVYNDVHISDTGEYVHAAPWSVTSQGHMNVSHGCINLSPANAAAFFAFSRVGDVVIVTGSPRPTGRRRSRRHGLGHGLVGVHAGGSTATVNASRTGTASTVSPLLARLYQLSSRPNGA